MVRQTDGSVAYEFLVSVVSGMPEAKSRHIPEADGHGPATMMEVMPFGRSANPLRSIDHYGIL
jgi:hypothetical protein